MACRNQICPGHRRQAAESRPSRCRLAHGPSMTALAARLIWPKHGGWLPPLAIPSLEVERGPRTAHEYGLSAARQALNFRFQETRKPSCGRRNWALGGSKILALSG